MKLTATCAVLTAALAVPLAASAEVRVVHDNTFAWVSSLPASTHTEVKRVRFTVTVPSTVIITSTSTIGFSSCSGLHCPTANRGQMFVGVNTGAKPVGSAAWIGSTTQAPAQMSLTGGVSNAATAVNGLMPISVTHTAMSLPAGEYDAVTSGFNSGIPASLKHYSTTVLIISN